MRRQLALVMRLLQPVAHFGPGITAGHCERLALFDRITRGQFTDRIGPGLER